MWLRCCSLLYRPPTSFLLASLPHCSPTLLVSSLLPFSFVPARRPLSLLRLPMTAPLACFFFFALRTLSSLLEKPRAPLSLSVCLSSCYCVSWTCFFLLHFLIHLPPFPSFFPPFASTTPQKESRELSASSSAASDTSNSRCTEAVSHRTPPLHLKATHLPSRFPRQFPFASARYRVYKVEAVIYSARTHTRSNLRIYT